MAVAPGTPADENQRLEALHDLAILDTPPEARFDRLTRIAARLFDVPIAMVSLVDADRQWLKSCVGLSETEIPREIGFCGHTILGEGGLVVPDAAADERFVDNPLVTGPPGIRFYAGEAVHAPNGHKVGTLSIADTRPREITAEQLDDLRAFADGVESELRAVELSRALSARRESEELVRALLQATVEGVLGLDVDGRITFVNAAAGRLLGWDPEEIVG